MCEESHASAQKISPAAPPQTGIEVALCAMTLTACLACDIFARPTRLTLRITAWLKGFCAVSQRASRVADLSHAKHFQEILRVEVPTSVAAARQPRAPSLNRLRFSSPRSSERKSAGLRAGASSARLLISVTCRAWRRRERGAKPFGWRRCGGPRPSVRRA